MAITKILNIQESEGRNPASHLKNALEYIQNPDKTEECVLVGGINCLPDTAFEQMEETKNIFHKTVLEPGGIDHSESSRNNQSELIRNSQCTSLAN